MGITSIANNQVAYRLLCELLRCTCRWRVVWCGRISVTETCLLLRVL